MLGPKAGASFRAVVLRKVARCRLQCRFMTTGLLTYLITGNVLRRVLNNSLASDTDFHEQRMSYRRYHYHSHHYQAYCFYNVEKA